MNAQHLVLPLLLLAATGLQAQERRVNAPIGPRDTDGTLYLFFFNPAEVQLKVIDQGALTGQSHESLGQAMVRHRGLAGCTASATREDGSPIGLIIADGTPSGKPDTTDLPAAAAVLHLAGDTLSLTRSTTYFAKPTAKAPPDQLLQAGPFLVEGGKAKPGLSGRHTARRTFLLTDGANRWAIGYAPATTLPKLAAALARTELFEGWTVDTAVLLNSGSGTGIWMQRQHSPLYLKEIRKTRTFLGLLPR